ncbi:hypothetical protein M3J09_005739 [Ascochyta lentis]
MASRHLYDCFDTQDKGHFYAADELYDKGVWVGYLAEGSRNTRYRQLPSFRELENNHKNLNLPYPTPLPDSSCNDREAVCRGCFGNRSIILQLREVRFGSHNKVLIMPLNGADEAGLFCIMLPQSMDRSIKALEAFRPFEHGIDRVDTEPFVNEYMLLAVRNRKHNSGVLHTVGTTLSPAELSRIANRPGRHQSGPRSSDQASLMKSIEKTSQGRLQKIAKRKRQQVVDDDVEPCDANKESRLETLTDPRMIASVVNLSDDDTAERLEVPNARRSVSKVRFEQQTPELQNNVPRPSLVQTNVPRSGSVNTSQFEEGQASRIYFIWKFDYEGTEYEAMRTLHEATTFGGLLDLFREEAEGIPSATEQIKSNMWFLKYKLADGTGKAVAISLKSQQFELNFSRLLRGLAEKKEWKEDPNATVEIELEAKSSGVIG